MQDRATASWRHGSRLWRRGAIRMFCGSWSSPWAGWVGAKRPRGCELFPSPYPLPAAGKDGKAPIDNALAHAAMQTLRRSRNWPAILKLLDERDSEPLRAVALRALAERFEPAVVDGLIERLRAEKDPARRLQYADW